MCHRYFPPTFVSPLLSSNSTIHLKYDTHSTSEANGKRSRTCESNATYTQTGVIEELCLVVPVSLPVLFQWFRREQTANVRERAITCKGSSRWSTEAFAAQCSYRSNGKRSRTCEGLHRKLPLVDWGECCAIFEVYKKNMYQYLLCIDILMSNTKFSLRSIWIVCINIYYVWIRHWMSNYLILIKSISYIIYSCIIHSYILII